MEDKYKIHAFYILTILITVIIILLTVKWTGIPNLVEYINFALTLTSLVLAALAIIYAFYSNSSFSQNISTLNNVSRDVSDTAKELSRATSDLSLKIESIPAQLEVVKGKVDQATVLIQQFSEKKDAPPPTDNEKRAASELVDLFITRMPPSGFFAIFACALAYAKGKPFKLADLTSKLESVDYKYAYGFIVATKSTGLLDATLTGDIWEITYMNEKLRQEIQINADEILSNISKPRGMGGSMDRLSAQKLTVEKFFETNEEDLPAT